MKRTSVMVTMAIFVLGATAGCSQQYNGAWGLKGSEAKAVKDYQKARQQSAEGVQQPTLPDRPRFSDQTDRAAGAAGRDGVADATAAPRTYGDATPSGGLLRLYGAVQRAGNGSETPLDGTENIRQITFTNEGSDFDPEVDPSGRWLVYASTQHRENADIYVKSVGATSVTQITNDPARDEMPTFSPDGHRIAFSSDRQGNWDIFMVDAAGGQPVQVTNDATDEIHPSFSPDGRKLVYCVHGQRSGQWELVVVELENPGRKHFLGYGLFPQWSPSGDKIVFQRARQRGTRWFSVWTLDLVNGEGHRFTEVVASSNAAAITPTWSPDGDHIVFCTVVNPDAEAAQRPLQADVWLVREDGTGRVNLTNSPFSNLQPAWGTDGSILFVSNRADEQRENIWALRPDAALRVTAGPGAYGPRTALADEIGRGDRSSVATAPPKP